MEYNIKDLSSTEKEIHITVPFQEFSPELEAHYKKAQQEVVLKGFRKGKVPHTLIKQYFGKDLEVQSIEKVSENHFKEISEKEKLTFIGKANIKDYTINGKENVTIIIHCEVMPTFELKPLSEYTFEKPIYPVSDSLIDEQLHNLQREKGTWITKDTPVERKDLVIVDLHVVDENGTSVLGKNIENKEYMLEYFGEDSAPVKSFLNKKIGETFLTTIPYVEKDGITSDDLKHTATIKEIKKLQLAELTDDLVKEVSNNEINTVAEIRDVIGKNLKYKNDERTERELRDKIISTLIADHPIDAPAALLRSKEAVERNKMMEAYQRYVPNYKPDAEFEKYVRENAEKKARWSIISTKISSTLDIKLAEEDFKHYFEHAAQANNMNVDQVAKFYLTNEVEMYLLQENLLEEKVIKELIASKLKINEKESLPAEIK